MAMTSGLNGWIATSTTIARKSRQSGAISAEIGTTCAKRSEKAIGPTRAEYGAT